MVSIMIHYAYFQGTFCGKCPKKQSNFATTSGWYKHIHHMSISQRKKKTWDMWLRFIQHSCNYVLLLQHVTALFLTIFSEEQPFKHSVGYLPVIKHGFHGISRAAMVVTTPCWLHSQDVSVDTSMFDGLSLRLYEYVVGYIYIYMCILLCISTTSI